MCAEQSNRTAPPKRSAFWSLDGTGWHQLAGGGATGPVTAAYNLEEQALYVGSEADFRLWKWSVSDGWADAGALPQLDGGLIPSLVYDGARRQLLEVNSASAWSDGGWVSIGNDGLTFQPAPVSVAWSPLHQGVLATSTNGPLLFTGTWASAAPVPAGTQLVTSGSGALMAVGNLDGGTWAYGPTGWSLVAPSPFPSCSLEPGSAIGFERTVVAFCSGKMAALRGSAWDVVTANLPLGSASLVPLGDGGAMLLATEAVQSLSSSTAYGVVSAPDAGLGLIGPTPGIVSRLPALGMDPDGALLAFGGFSPDSTPRAEVAGYVGQWTGLGLADPEGDGDPSPRGRGSLVWQPTRNRFLLAGCTSMAFGGAAMPSAWELVIDENRPSLVFEVALQTAQIPDEAELTGLSVSALAGGTGPGAALELHLDGTWVRQAVNAAPPGAPAGLATAVSDPVTLERLLRHQSWLDAAVVSKRANGSSRAEVSMDSIVAVVRYRLPAL